MLYYMGSEFNKETCKLYKKIEAAQKAADKNKSAIFDEDGNVVYDSREENGMSDTLPQTENKTKEEIEVTNEEEIIDGVPAKKVKGKIRRVFNGAIRIRKSPSWGNEAVKGATTFNEMLVTHILTVDNKPMYRTHEGMYISGEENLVKFIEM